MRKITTGKLSIMFGGGIFAVSLVSVVSAAFGMPVTLAVEGASAIAGMLVGARVA